MFELAYQQDGSRRKQLTINSDRCSIGSGRQNDIVLKSRRISRKHAVMFLQNNQVQIEDLGSMTGTWVNRERVIASDALGIDDEITIGDTRFWLHKEVAKVAQAAAKTTPPATTDSAANEADGAENNATPAPAANTEMQYWGKILHERLITEMDRRLQHER